MIMNKNWDDIEDTLFDGTSDEISNLKCPDCKSGIFYSYNEKVNSLEYGCKNCGRIIKANGCHQVPNCSKH